jgi:uncharacterized protein YhbP (UPF0306 family)
MSGLVTVRRSIADGPVRASLLRILRGNILCSVASVTRRGRAHIHTAYFAFSARPMEIYFLSDADSVHARNLEANPSAAVAIFDSSQRWGRSDRGVQLFGSCRQATGPAARTAERAYARRFAPYARWLAATTEGGRRAAARFRSYRFYRFVPGEAKILDERVFGGGVFVLARVPRPLRRRGV